MRHGRVSGGTKGNIFGPKTISPWLAEFIPVLGAPCSGPIMSRNNPDDQNSALVRQGESCKQGL